MIIRLAEALGWFTWSLITVTIRTIWALIRPGLKVLSFVLLLAAIIALTSDVTRWQTGAEGPLFQSLAAIITQTAPASFEAIGKTVTQGVHPFAWDPVMMTLLSLPAWVTLLAGAIGLALASRERTCVNIFVN
jgi:hypothetical protein